jgi:hypothetical protein
MIPVDGCPTTRLKCCFDDMPPLSKAQLGMPDVAERRSVSNKSLIIGTDSRAFQQNRRLWLTHAGEARLSWQAAM